jgi:serpin B
LKSAFTPEANFGRIAAHGIYISDIFHKTFIALDESGTEAAAATAVVMDKMGSPFSERPTIVRVDHPFFYAIQDVATGACIFLGRVVDPE